MFQEIIAEHERRHRIAELIDYNEVCDEEITRSMRAAGLISSPDMTVISPVEDDYGFVNWINFDASYGFYVYTDEEVEHILCLKVRTCN